MKSPAPKIHLIDLCDPIEVWRGLIARCGYQFTKAHAKTMYSDELKPGPERLQAIYPIGLCRKCLRKEPQGDERRRYLYLLVEAQEEKFLEVGG